MNIELNSETMLIIFIALFIFIVAVFFSLFGAIKNQMREISDLEKRIESLEEELSKFEFVDEASYDFEEDSSKEYGSLDSYSIFKDNEITPASFLFNNEESYTVTAYCPCIKCCGKEDGITASGIKAVSGITVAADTDILPFGTEILIEGIGHRIVQDRGGAIKGKSIDIFFDTHEEALMFGRQNLKVYIYPNSKEEIENGK
jgi:3D (Asp-Asp-Asp) domain-containing protein